MQAASVAHRHGSVPLLCVLHALTGIVHAARAEAPAPFRFPARTIASHNTMSAKGMGDKRPAAIASVGDAASGAKAAMRTPYGRLRNRARTRSVRPPRPVRCAIRARVARQTAAARPARKSPLTAADPAARRWPRIACRGKAPASRPVRRNTGRVARKETAARSVNPYRAHCVSGLLASGGQWHTEHIASCPMRHNTGRVARRTAAARPARKPPPIPRRDADPGPVCLPWGKMRGARFCAVAFLSGVPIPHPVCTLHAFPHGRQIRRRRSLRAIFIPRWPSSGTKSAIRRRMGRRSAQRNHIPIIHKLFVKCKFNEELFIKYSFFIAFNDPDPPEWPCEPVRHSGCCARYRRAL